MILYTLAGIVIAYVLSAIGIAPRRDRQVKRQYGAPYANNMARLAERARSKRESA